MNKFVAAFAAIAIGMSTIPFVTSNASAQQQGTHSDGIPGMYQSPQERYFHRNGNRAYYQGQRGYRYQRQGYQNYNGFWFPAAAFLGAAVIGGIIQNGSNHSGSHVAYCQNRYRSYRMSDNTFQPNVGPRRACQ